ncbi:DUF6153 family protein [Actinacidiphila glaucinigra]|uniref:DUF6153 family protein n=1 Tax=Actinacidiphila glaucinigra TaxID=235986 RepID=UPI003712CFB8
MSPIKPTPSARPRRQQRTPALLVLAVLIGLLGMHGLALADPPPGGHTGHTSHMAPAETGGPYACHGGGMDGHGAHAHQMCSSGSLPGSAAVPALTVSVTGDPVTTPHPVTRVPHEPAGGRAPPSLAELQLLRI